MTIYWANILKCSPEIISTAGLHLVPRDNPAISGLLTYQSTVISLPKQDFTYYSDKLKPLYEKHLITYVDVINLLTNDIAQCGYLLYQGYAEKEDLIAHSTVNVRLVQESDRHLLADLQQNVHPIEWQHSGMDKEQPVLFGYFLDGKIVAASNYLLWGNDSASIGVLTHGAYRGQGYCKAVATAAMEHAIGQGLFVLYQTIAENRPSIAMAKRLGVKDFGLSFRVTLKD